MELVERSLRASAEAPRVIADELSIPDNQMLVCGMSLGYADHNCIENSLVTDRAPVSDFTTFYNE